MKKIAVLIIWCLMTSLSFAEDVDGLDMKEVSTEFDGVEYTYKVGEFDPPIEIKYFEDGGIHNESPIGTVVSLYTQMKNLNWEGFKEIPYDFDATNKRLKEELGYDMPSEEKYIEGWKVMMRNPLYIKYRIDYRDFMIYIIEWNNDEGALRRTSAEVKKVGESYYTFIGELAEDELTWKLHHPTFDVFKGKFIE